MSSNSRCFKETDAEPGNEDFEPEDDVTHLLSQNTYSFDINVGSVSRADGAQLASSSPCEDRFNHVQPLSLWEDEKWIVSTVFDGHSGWQTADFLEKKLLFGVQSNLRRLQPEQRGDDTLIQDAIRKAFVELDNSIIDSYVNSAHDEQMKLKEKMRYMQVALSGSCALFVLYNPTACTLYTACTGDSRAVLAHQDHEAAWEYVELSEDQKGDNESEIARIQKEHPGEEAAHDGRVLGLAVSRAFGDSPWKISYDLQLELGKRFCTQGPKEKSTIPTPPYLTAEPVITVTELNQPCFLVLATDGLWDECSNREVVDLVARWLGAQPKNATLLNTIPSSKIDHLPEPVQHLPGFDFLQRWHGFDMRFLEERTTLQDLDNVAVHLLRNACGGSHEELLTAKLAAQPPYSRQLRDDMTVQVVFFNLAE